MAQDGNGVRGRLRRALGRTPRVIAPTGDRDEPKRASIARAAEQAVEQAVDRASRKSGPPPPAPAQSRRSDAGAKSRMADSVTTAQDPVKKAAAKKARERAAKKAPVKAPPPSPVLSAPEPELRSDAGANKRMADSVSAARKNASARKAGATQGPEPAATKRPTATKSTAKAAPAKGAKAPSATAVPAKGAKAAPAKAAPAKAAPAKGAKNVTAPAAPATEKVAATKKVNAKAAAAAGRGRKQAAEPPPPVALPAKRRTGGKRTEPAQPSVAVTSAATERAPGRTPSVPEGERPWTKKELGQIRAELDAQAAELRAEIDSAEVAWAALQRDGGGEGAGDDQADAGTATFEREHEMSLANNSRDLLAQVQRALQRLDDGSYGSCESCGRPIGKARLQAFPRATLCVSCKQREERR